jgi:hypothetical protein
MNVAGNTQFDGMTVEDAVTTPQRKAKADRLWNKPIPEPHYGRNVRIAGNASVYRGSCYRMLQPAVHPLAAIRRPPRDTFTA